MPEINIIGNKSFGETGGQDSDQILKNLVRSMQLDPNLISSANRLRNSPIPNISGGALFGSGKSGGSGDQSIQAITQSLSAISSTNQTVTNSLNTMIQELRQVIGLLGNIQSNTAQATRGRGRTTKAQASQAAMSVMPEEHIRLDLPPGSMVPRMNYDQFTRATRGADANIHRWTEGPSRQGINFRSMGSMETALAIAGTTALVGGMARPSMGGGPTWNRGGRVVDQYPDMLSGPNQRRIEGPFTFPFGPGRKRGTSDQYQDRLEAPYRFPFEDRFGPMHADRTTRDAYAWDPTKLLGGPHPFSGRPGYGLGGPGSGSGPRFGGGWSGTTYTAPPGSWSWGGGGMGGGLGGGGGGFPPLGGAGLPLGGPGRMGGTMFGPPLPPGPNTMFGGMPGGGGGIRGAIGAGGLLMSPFLIAGGMQKWSNLARESDRYVEVTSQLARGMANTSDSQKGFNILADRNFDHFLGGLGWRSEKQPPWLSRLGLSPLDAAKLARTYPVAPRNQSEIDIISSTRGGIPFMRGMGQLNPGTANSLVTQGGMYGVGAPNDYVAGLNLSMSHAISNRMPTEGLATGIMGTQDILAGMGGGNLDMNQINNFNTQMQDVGLAGSRTGQLGQQVLQSVAGGFGQAFGGNAPAANTLGNLVLDIKSEHDLASRMGMSDDEMRAKMASTDKADKPFQDMVRGFWDAKQQGIMPVAASYLQSAAGFAGKVNPNLMMVNEAHDILIRQGFKESDPRFKLMQAAMAGLTGTPGGVTPLQQMEIIQQANANGPTGTPSTGNVRIPSTGANRPTRNNNPGDIVYGDFARGMGATGGDKPGSKEDNQAIFPTAQAGFEAERKLLFGPSYNTLTISQAMQKWVHNDSNWLAKNPNDVEMRNHINQVLAANENKDVVVNTLDARHQQAVLEANSRAEGWQGGGELIDPRQGGILQRQNEVGTANTEAARTAAEAWNISLGQFDQVLKDASNKIENIMNGLGPAFQHGTDR